MGAKIMSDELNPALAQTLSLVSPQRRSSLAKLLVAQLMIGGAVALTAPAMTTIALAEDGAKASQAKSETVKSSEKTSGEKNVQDTASSASKAKAAKPKPAADPSKLAKQWIKKFDADGDGCLGQEELTLAIQAMQESVMQDGTVNKAAAKGTAVTATKPPSESKTKTKTKTKAKAKAKASAKPSSKTTAKTKPVASKVKPTDK